MRKKLVLSGIIVAVLAITGGWLFGSATYRWYMAPGLSVGDILYADQTNRMTDLDAGATGTVLQSAGLLTAPAYVAKNTMREATIHNFATAAASWTLSSDEALCYYLASTNASGSATIRLPTTGGKVFFFRNGSGQNNVLAPGDLTIATATAVEVIYATDLTAYIKRGTVVVAP